MDLEIQIPANDIKINADAVLRAQGADAAIVRARSPYLVEIADRALASVQHWLEPKVLSRQLEVKSLLHEKLELEGGFSISGSLVTQHLAASQSVIAVLCTVGPRVEGYASELMSTDLLLGFAIDAVGSAGVQTLANAVCGNIERYAAESHLQTTVPLSPGMIGWPVEEGQPFIFKLLEATKIGVELTSHYVMIPRKTLSMLIGIGTEANTKGNTCDFCTMKLQCRYQDHYRHVTI